MAGVGADKAADIGSFGFCSSPRCNGTLCSSFLARNVEPVLDQAVRLSGDSSAAPPGIHTFPVAFLSSSSNVAPQSSSARNP